MLPWTLTALLAIAAPPPPIAIDAASATASATTAQFTDEWAARIPGGLRMAKLVARDLGYVIVGKIGMLDDHFRLTRKFRRVKRGATDFTHRLRRDKRVKWAAQQIVRVRVKRDLIDKRSEVIAYETLNYNDPLWGRQWYLHDLRNSTDFPKQDLHVLPVWKKGITGNGVVVTILDDGVEGSHDDLKANWDPKASIDLNDNDDDPTPRYEETHENKHGTRCAGEVAMAANNSVCGVGVAYEASIGGVRMLDGKVTDSLEAAALSHAIDHVDIFSASWGPTDDGKTVEGPGELTSKALQKGATEGRGGKGVIYVWASGNGGSHDDDCNCDGYTGSIYTISVSSASETFNSPWFSEHCASTMATTFSSGAFGEDKISTADLENKCTTSHTGTSASAPLAAGVVALLLQANPALGWRDVQHLITWTSEHAPLADNPGWTRNAAGFWVNARFGFGLLDATALVNAATAPGWTAVPPAKRCELRTGPRHRLPMRIASGGGVQLRMRTSACRGGAGEVRRLEHVELVVTLTYSARGRLSVFLTSPGGTVAQLLARRPSDASTDGFREWPFTSVHTWGEDPAGLWTVNVTDDKAGSEHGELTAVSLVMHGTGETPGHVVLGENGRRKYNEHYNSVLNERSNRKEMKHDRRPPKQSASGWRNVREERQEEAAGKFWRSWRKFMAESSEN